jgi:hypothetical protein
LITEGYRLKNLGNGDYGVQIKRVHAGIIIISGKVKRS